MKAPMDIWLGIAAAPLAIYAMVTGGFCGVMLAYPIEPHKNVTDWLLPIVYVLTAIVLLPAVCLFFARRPGALHAAWLLLLLGGVGLVSEVVLIIINMQRPGGAVGKALVEVPSVIIALLVFCVVVFALVRVNMMLKRIATIREPSGVTPDSAAKLRPD